VTQPERKKLSKKGLLVMTIIMTVISIYLWLDFVYDFTPDPKDKPNGKLFFAITLASTVVISFMEFLRLYKDFKILHYIAYVFAVPLIPLFIVAILSQTRLLVSLTLPLMIFGIISGISSYLFQQLELLHLGTAFNQNVIPYLNLTTITVVFVYSDKFLVKLLARFISEESMSQRAKDVTYEFLDKKPFTKIAYLILTSLFIVASIEQLGEKELFNFLGPYKNVSLQALVTFAAIDRMVAKWKEKRINENIGYVDIICDTHIWYGIGWGLIDTSKVHPTNRLIASYNNIDELCSTQKLIDSPDYVVKAIQAVFKHSGGNTIHDTPFIHLKKLSDPSFKIDGSDDIGAMLEFSERIASGDTVDKSKETEYREFSAGIKKQFQDAADAMNKEALRIKEANKGKKLVKREDRIPQVRELISSFVEIQCGEGLPSNFDWKNVELFENVLLDFYISVERGATTITTNDWHDLFLLAYVQPGKMVWTREKKWKRFIDDAGMNKYRYDI
jgi:hypothetical protein